MIVLEELKLSSTMIGVSLVVFSNFTVYLVVKCFSFLIHCYWIVKRNFFNQCSVIATVMALPSPATSGRLLLLLKSISETETSSSKRAKKKSSFKVGSLVQAEVYSL